MGKQWKTVKENWIIFLVLVVIILLVSNFNIGNVNIGSYGVAENLRGDVAVASGFYGDDFAPEVEIRKIIYSASVGVEVPRGGFSEAEDEFNRIVEERKGIVLNRNVNTYGNTFERKIGYYNVRIPADDLDDFLGDLREIGKVESFSKDARDVTGNYVSLGKQLVLEVERLERFKAILEDTENINDKISLTDKIFEQERRVAYLEEAISGQDERIEYASVSFTMEEKQSDLAGIGFVTVGELVRGFVESLSSLVRFVFIVLPWALILGIVWFIFKRLKR